jgi:hypothetical protein
VLFWGEVGLEKGDYDATNFQQTFDVRADLERDTFNTDYFS